MAATTDAQRAHDALLAAKPTGATHEPCHLCPAPSAEQAKEAAEVAEPRTFTEAEHFALLTDAVKRETAAVTTELGETKDKLSTAEQRVDVLEAEKAAATAEREKVQAEFDAFKAEITEKAQIAERKEARVQRVKAANDMLKDDYFTDERAQRWAEMADADFDVVVASLEAAKPAGTTPAPGTPATPPVQTAAFTGGTSPKSTDGQPSTASRLLGFRRGATVGS